MYSSAPGNPPPPDCGLDTLCNWSTRKRPCWCFAAPLCTAPHSTHTDAQHAPASTRGTDLRKQLPAAAKSLQQHQQANCMCHDTPRPIVTGCLQGTTVWSVHGTCLLSASKTAELHTGAKPRDAKFCDRRLRTCCNCHRTAICPTAAPTLPQLPTATTPCLTTWPSLTPPPLAASLTTQHLPWHGTSQYHFPPLWGFPAGSV